MTTSSYTPSHVQSLTTNPVQNDGKALQPITPCGHGLDATKRDRFELLSAYLDGEVTPNERQQVLSWLRDCDDTRSLYNRLLSLRQGMRTQACPPACDTDETLGGVFHQLNHRIRLVSMACAGVAAFSVIHLLSGAGAGNGAWRMATGSQPEVLHIALDQPAFPIPETSSMLDVSGPIDQGGLPIDSEL